MPLLIEHVDVCLGRNLSDTILEFGKLLVLAIDCVIDLSDPLVFDTSNSLDTGCYTIDYAEDGFLRSTVAF